MGWRLADLLLVSLWMWVIYWSFSFGFFPSRKRIVDQFEEFVVVAVALVVVAQLGEGIA